LTQKTIDRKIEIPLGDIERVQTGIPGLDEMLCGGIPKNHIVSVFGGPGTGKTTFAMQFLCNGALKYNEPGIYVSLDEKPPDLRKDMSHYGWNLGTLEREKKIMLLDVSPFKSETSFLKLENVKQKGYSVLSLANLIIGTVERLDAKRVVIDPLTTLIIHFPEIHERRKAVMELLRALRTQPDITSLITMDMSTTALEREYQVEEYLTQGTILLQTIMQHETGLSRTILIEKMRSTEHDNQPRPYRIGPSGVQVFCKEKIYAKSE
jgi:KaiC/GvpD/RAD55 family RecA-like ATPase